MTRIAAGNALDSIAGGTNDRSMPTRRSGNIVASSIEEYVSKIDPSLVDGTRKIVAIMRKGLPGAREQVRFGIAIFVVGERDAIGIAARSGFYSIYVPAGTDVREFASRLGRTSHGGGCIRFRTLHDIDLGELRKLVAQRRRAVSAATPRTPRTTRTPGAPATRATPRSTRADVPNGTRSARAPKPARAAAVVSSREPSARREASRALPAPHADPGG
ncbi:MAG: DUF1801 domain-containing protein [Phycisphaerales bacterium]